MCIFLYVVVHVHTSHLGSIVTVNSCLSLEKHMASGSQHVADIDKMVFVKENWFQKKTLSFKTKCIQQTDSLFKRHM